jgi:hypothetical protein
MRKLDEIRQLYPELFSNPALWEMPAVVPEEDDNMVVKLANEFLVGCDPEFCVLDGQGRVYNVVNEFRDAHGEVGFDHGGLEVELRPQPAKGTYALTRRMRTLLLRNAKLNPALVNYKWRAGAVVEHANQRLLTLGGHVHFGIQPRGYDPADRDGSKFDLRIKALDRTTKYLEALDILPRDESTLRRERGDRQNANQRYGRWSDVRIAGERGDAAAHIEYRTMASWLFDPKVAYTCLTAAKLACAAPQIALDSLKANNYSYNNFVKFFEVFRHKDTNAKRALEKLLDGKEVTALQVPPDVNLRTRWEPALEF